MTRKHKVWTGVAIEVMTFLIAYIDYLVPQEVPVDILYLLPIGLGTAAFSWRGAMTISTISLLLFVFVNYGITNQLTLERQEIWFAILLTGILLYGLGWGSYLFRLNQIRLYRTREALEKQVSDLNTLYLSSQNLVEQGLSDTVRLIEQLVENIAKATSAKQLHLELSNLLEFEHLLHRFRPSTSGFSVAMANASEVEGLYFSLVVNNQEFGKLHIESKVNETESYSRFAADSSSNLSSILPQSPLVLALIRHLALALQNYSLHQQGLLLAVTEERNRLAREMHDVLAQGFTGIIFQAQVAAEDCADQQMVRQRLAGIEQLARYNLQEARRSVANLRPLSLDGQNLIEALQQQAKTFMRENVEFKVSFEMNGKKRNLPAEVENALYRISQEALNNVKRHAHAHHVRLSLDFDEDELCLTVSDDGCGFNPGASTTQSEDGRRKFGLATMRERAKLVGGLLMVDSEQVADATTASDQLRTVSSTLTVPYPINYHSRIRVIVPYDKMKYLVKTG